MQNILETFLFTNTLKLSLQSSMTALLVIALCDDDYLQYNEIKKKKVFIFSRAQPDQAQFKMENESGAFLRRRLTSGVAATDVERTASAHSQ